MAKIKVKGVLIFFEGDVSHEELEAINDYLIDNKSPSTRAFSTDIVKGVIDTKPSMFQWLYSLEHFI